MVEDTDVDFHARFSAREREYEYHIVKYFSPITRNYTSPLKWKVDRKLLKECADLLVGEHDFTSFCKSTAEVDNKLCIVHSVSWEETTERFIFNIRANRFLQHMVRYLVGTMLEVARGRYSITDFKKLLDIKKTEAVVLRAPAKGLFLKQVYYN